MLNSLNSWRVLHTKPKAELKLAERLRQNGFNVYCPTIIQIRQWSDRKKKLTVPVLPSMILINIDERSRNKVFDFPGAVRYLFWMGKIAEVTEKEVELLKLSLEGNTILSHRVHDCKVGSELELKEFGNRKGVVKKSSAKKIWVELKELNCVVALDVA